MERLITWSLAGIFSLGLVLGFQYLTDQLENSFHYTGTDIEAEMESYALQKRFNEALENGEIEELFPNG